MSLITVGIMTSHYRIKRTLLALLLLVFVLALAVASMQLIRLNEIVVEDIFGRRLNDYGIVLVDWEGYIANPAIEFMLKPPANAVFPAHATLTAHEPRLYFDLSPECSTPPYLYDPCSTSSVGPDGPSRTLRFSDNSPQSVYLSIFPDRDSFDENYSLTIQFTDDTLRSESETITVNVIDQDINQPPIFRIEVDFSKDTTGFFSDPILGAQRRAIVQQAADDWAYFIGDMKLDPYTGVPVEQGWIWDSRGYVAGSCVDNVQPYADFLIYVIGISPSPAQNNAAGSSTPVSVCPRAGRFSSNGRPLTPALWRSGWLAIPVKGSFGAPGWFLTTTDADWWMSANLRGEIRDLYSVAHHEIGHDLVFNSYNSEISGAETKGFLSDAYVVAYNGSKPGINSDYHFGGDPNDRFGGVIDKASRKGAFGNEYNGLMPNRRWLITKFDLLALRAGGYLLRNTSCLVSPSIATNLLPAGVVATPYSVTLNAVGGIPFYDWTIEAGALPPGLTLDRFTGTISGKPSSAGVFGFSVRLRDYQNDTPGVVKNFALVIIASH